MSRTTESVSGSPYPSPDPVEAVLAPRTVDLGNFQVYRLLPAKFRQLVGPFIFWDQIGPGTFSSGNGLDVRPHPHIGLATVTYLFEGTLDHRDSLGNHLRIVPGEVNLMYAGSGIVHSERTGIDVRRNPSLLFGIQSWMAQPRQYEHEHCHFSHIQQDQIPGFAENGIQGSVVMGEFQGLASPVPTQWPSLYVVLKLRRGSRVTISDTVQERAVHLITGTISLAGMKISQRHLAICRPGKEVVLTAVEDSRLILLGGAPLDGPRYLWWNLVSSSPAAIRAAAERWQNRDFPHIPGDDLEFIPLPDLPFPTA